MGRKRPRSDEEYTPESERRKKKRLSNKRRKKQVIKRANDNRDPEVIKRANDSRNAGRKMKSAYSGLVYDLNSPFPPTLEQVGACGHILSNSIAAVFAQQSPPAEISYSVLVVEELKLYITPIMEYTMYKFNQECCLKTKGDIDFGKASANEALNTMDKLLLFNNHYQLMDDFTVWDIYNPPTLLELKKLASRHPYQPQSSLLRNEICKHKEKIHERMFSIISYRVTNTQWQEGIGLKEAAEPGDIIHPERYEYADEEEYSNLENNNLFRVVGGALCKEVDCRFFGISMNDVSALYINKDAKFSKIFTEGRNKSFLLPHNFKDDTMRNYYLVKYYGFVEGINSSNEIGN